MRKQIYTSSKFQEDIEALTEAIAGHLNHSLAGYQPTGLYGIPRGGIPVAIALATNIGLPLYTEQDLISIKRGEKQGCPLIVDDIVDTGQTMAKELYEGFSKVALHIKEHTPVDKRPLFFVDCLPTETWIDYWWEQNTPSEGIQENITRILQYIGEDPTRVGLVDTPKRVAKMYQEFFCGYDPKRKPNITTFPNGQDGIVYNEMLIDSGYFFSFCEHHVIPFFGEYYYGYIPDTLIMGASKIGRTIDYYAGRLQVAERLVNQVVNEIEAVAAPKGQVLVMKARHLCKEMRGLKKWNSPFEAIAVRGYFDSNYQGCKDEFMARIASK